LPAFQGLFIAAFFMTVLRAIHFSAGAGCLRHALIGQYVKACRKSDRRVVALLEKLTFQLFLCLRALNALPNKVVAKCSATAPDLRARRTTLKVEAQLIFDLR